MTEQNPVGLDGLEFIEYAGPTSKGLVDLFTRLGQVRVAEHRAKKISLYRQNDINFLLNTETTGFAPDFAKAHGPCVCSTGFRVFDAQKAFDTAVARGAKPFTDEAAKAYPYPAVYGIGGSLIYFVEKYGDKGEIYDEDFQFTADDPRPKGKGLLVVDHMTNNVPKGDLEKWAKFYEDIFNFKEIRFFDIKGGQTGLLSKAMRSPCKKLTIPINEPTEDKSQIQEYLDEYKGSGIQHIALLTEDICDSVSKLRKDEIPVLDIPDAYYDVLLDRVPNITEDIRTLNDLQILADGDSEGYLLQLFSKNLIGPIFYEFIQRKNHYGFGEGNFQALFEAIERDQEQRGVL